MESWPVQKTKALFQDSRGVELKDEEVTEDFENLVAPRGFLVESHEKQLAIKKSIILLGS